MLSPDVTILKSRILQGALHVIPTRCAWEENCLENSHFVLFNVLRRHSFDKQKECEGECSALFCLANKKYMKGMQWITECGMNEKQCTEYDVEEKSAESDSSPFPNCEYVLQDVLLISSFVYLLSRKLWLSDVHLTYSMLRFPTTTQLHECLNIIIY